MATMKDPSLVAFEAHRAHLLGIAYRMLGEMSGAEDIVQEAWLRWQRQDATTIRDPRAWLSAVTIRLALDALRSARARRETYVGPWLPEPLMPDDMRLPPTHPRPMPNSLRICRWPCCMCWSACRPKNAPR